MPAPRPTRRFFLTATGGAALGAGEWAGLLPLSPAGADEAMVTPDLVRFGPELEPVVRLIEETPRAGCPAMMIGQLRKGLPYRNFLAALFLANLRTHEGVEHPSAVLHSAHKLALDLPPEERLLPAFWALDSFKFHQERSRDTPCLRPLPGALPSAERAEAEFHAGMKAFDFDRAQRAMAVLARSQPPDRVGEHLWRYGARDWSFIGHNAIWVANTWQTLQAVGWRHAETTLRVLVRQVLGGLCDAKPTPRAEADALGDQPYLGNCRLVEHAAGKLPGDWAGAGADVGFTNELLGLIRERASEAACRLAQARLAGGRARAGAVWDAVHLAAAEIVLNRPWDGGTALHANTGSCALHYAFRASTGPEDRLVILLQAVAWMCLYRGAVADALQKGEIKETRSVTELAGADLPPTEDAAAGEILEARRSHPEEAMRKAFEFALRHPRSDVLRRAAARLLPLKATWNPHEIKFPIAMFEKSEWVSPEWRPHIAAVTVLALKGTDDDDMPVVHRVREALRAL
jgi:hypothetical protein